MLRGRRVHVTVMPGLGTFIRQFFNPLFGVQVFGLLTSGSGDELRGITTLIEAGKLKTVIDKVFPVAEIVAAQNYSKAGRAKGKVVLQSDVRRRLEVKRARGGAREDGGDLVADDLDSGSLDVTFDVTFDVTLTLLTVGSGAGAVVQAFLGCIRRFRLRARIGLPSLRIRPPPHRTGQRIPASGSPRRRLPSGLWFRSAAARFRASVCEPVVSKDPMSRSTISLLHRFPAEPRRLLLFSP